MRKPKKDAPKHSHRHTVYKNKEGKRIVSSTGALNILAKPALIYWAWDLGMSGVDYRKYTDDKGQIGTLTHDMILSHHKKCPYDTSDYTQKQINTAETCFLKYLEWEGRLESIEPIMLERSLVSEKYQYGGTFDFYGLVEGVYTLMDYKTSKAIYPDNFLQLASYRNLLIENGHSVERAMIVRVGRDETEGFETKEMYDLDLEFQTFIRIVELHYMLKETNKKFKG
mgnify:FL=1|jgi:hypothetical protein